MSMSSNPFKASATILTVTLQKPYEPNLGTTCEHIYLIFCQIMNNWKLVFTVES